MSNYNAEKFAVEIQTILATIENILNTKNADYGNNVDKNIDEWGLSSLAIRLSDKLNRFSNLIKDGKNRQVLDEAIEDTLLDLAGYSILGYRKIREMNMNDRIVDEWNKIPNVNAVYIPDSKIQKDQTTFSYNEQN